MKACTYAPKKGTQTFYKFKKELGYQLAWEIIGIAANPKFQQEFKETLSFDTEGIPTYESLMNNEYIQKYIGDKPLINLAQNEFKSVEDTIDNYYNCLEQAYKFNSENNKLMAIVDYFDDKIGVKIVPRTSQNETTFKDQYSSYTLNKQIVTILEPLGITVGDLMYHEQQAGRVGVIDFSIARRIAIDTISMIRVANNREGADSLSEEFSHLILGALKRKNPLVDRTIDSLSQDKVALRDILGSQYEDTVEFHNGDMSLVAEEALGKLLQKNLKYTIQESKSQTLLQRFIAFVKNLFKSLNADEVLSAVTNADAAMSVLAKDIVANKIKLTREDIETSHREVAFNNLSERVDRNISILKAAKETETKRYKISQNEASRSTFMERAGELDYYMQDDQDALMGIMKYTQHAITDLKAASEALKMVHQQSPKNMFETLRGIRTSLQSYSKFISLVNDVITSEELEGDSLFAKRVIEYPDGSSVELDVPAMMKELNDIFNSLATRLMRVSKDKFAEFLKPFLGEEITIELGKHKGEKIAVRQLLDVVDKDISFMDRWLDAMGDSSDVLLQAFDAIVKKANDTARLETIKFVRKIQALRREAESLGIRDFEWMFETYKDGSKTGDYIGEINYNQFYKDREEMESRLNQKYGKNPTGDAAKAKIAEREAWLNKYGIMDPFSGKWYANASEYRNTAFDNLTDNQRIIRQKFLNLKTDLEGKLPENRVDLLKAIQIRKDGIQRFIDVASSPSTIVSSLKEHLASELLEREDDDAIFGDTSIKKGLTDFAGQEFMTLPILYTTRLSKPEELSTDIFGTLMAYSAMAYKYEQLEQIIDPLEVGRSIIVDKGRRVRKNRGNNKLIEKFQALGESVENHIFEESGTNIEKRLQDFFESQVYQRHLKDQGTFDVFGKKVNVNKLVSYVLNKSSVAQLGLNFLAQVANVTTGVAMQNIEAASYEFFTPKELAKADGIYAKEVVKFIAEIESRDKKSKLALVDQLFNIKGNFNKDLTNADQRNNWLKRLFGNSVMFLGQECGDHWLYNRTAIAMMLKEKVNVPNKGEMTLWDALTVKEENDSGVLELPKGTINSKGEPFDIGKFGRKILHVNQSMFGVYNEEDSNAANRVAMGRLLMQYRKWMKAQFNKRFQAGQKSLATEQWEEGYYRTAFNLISNLVRGQVQFASCFDQMTDHEKANIRRAVIELIQCFAVWALADLLEWPDDEKRPWAIKLAEYSTKRLSHELGNLTPSTLMVTEMLKTVKTPMPVLSFVEDLVRLTNSIIDPRDWIDELQSGPYKGMSTLEKNFFKAPLPLIAPANQISRFTGDIDAVIDYYARSSY